MASGNTSSVQDVCGFVLVEFLGHGFAILHATFGGLDLDVSCFAFRSKGKSKPYPNESKANPIQFNAMQRVKESKEYKDKIIQG